MENSKLDRILERLDDINLLRTEINELKSEVTRALKQTQDSLDLAHDEIKSLKDQQSDTVQQFDSYRKAEDNRIKDLRDDFNQECVASKLYSYKYNLIFSGIPGNDSNKRETERILRNFWAEKLEMDPTEIYLADVHRMGPVTSDGPRNIIAKFLQLSDRDYILRQGNKLKNYRSTKVTPNGKSINHQTYTIHEHIPPQLVDKKKKGLMPFFRQAASMGLKRKFKVIGSDIHLLVNGQKFHPSIHVISQRGLSKRPERTHLRFNSQDQTYNTCPGKVINQFHGRICYGC